LFTLATSGVFQFFLAGRPQSVLLHRFPPLKPCANEFSLPFSYTKTLARPWRDFETQQLRKKGFAQGLSGGKRSGRAPWGCLARGSARIPEVVKVNNYRIVSNHWSRQIRCQQSIVKFLNLSDSCQFDVLVVFLVIFFISFKYILITFHLTTVFNLY
jgi:hypothetical protein